MFSGPKIFRDLNVYRSKIFWDPKIFSGLKFFWELKFFGTENILFPSHKQGISVIYSPFNNLAFAQPYLERTFTWNSSVAQLSLACFYYF